VVKELEQDATKLIMHLEKLWRAGKQVLDAGDVVAAVARSGMAWQLGKTATRAWQVAGQVRWRWRWHWRAARG
jgi:hypothetical protein